MMERSCIVTLIKNKALLSSFDLIQRFVVFDQFHNSLSERSVEYPVNSPNPERKFR